MISHIAYRLALFLHCFVGRRDSRRDSRGNFCLVNNTQTHTKQTYTCYTLTGYLSIVWSHVSMWTAVLCRIACGSCVKYIWICNFPTKTRPTDDLIKNNSGELWIPKFQIEVVVTREKKKIIIQSGIIVANRTQSKKIKKAIYKIYMVVSNMLTVNAYIWLIEWQQQHESI